MSVRVAPPEPRGSQEADDSFDQMLRERVAPPPFYVSNLFNGYHRFSSE